MPYKTIQLPLVCINITCGGGGALKKIMCLDSYFYLGIKITIFFETTIFFQIGGGGGGGFKNFCSILLFVGVDRNLVFLWGNL
jgi:hypothetical protein